MIIDPETDSVLLARRKGEADYDGVYSLIGGKIETTDSSILDAIRREKNEGIGNAAKNLDRRKPLRGRLRSRSLVGV
ncbi:NUDIX domain-containing protein [Nocardia africana]